MLQHLSFWIYVISLRMTFHNMPIYVWVLQFYFTKQLNGFIKVIISIDHSYVNSYLGCLQCLGIFKRVALSIDEKYFYIEI